jgi:hypothetical protein
MAQRRLPRRCKGLTGSGVKPVGASEYIAGAIKIILRFDPFDNPK